MRILHVPIIGHWFDMIESGEKKEEYRTQKLYWQKRLFNKDGTPKQFDIIRFRNGYSRESRTMDVVHLATSVGIGKKKWGGGDLCIILHLGAIKNRSWKKKPALHHA